MLQTHLLIFFKLQNTPVNFKELVPYIFFYQLGRYNRLQELRLRNLYINLESISSTFTAAYFAHILSPKKYKHKL